MTIQQLRKPAWAIIIAAFLLTSIMTFLVGHIEDEYLTHYSYYYDPATYAMHDARLSARLGEEGRLQTAIEEWLKNARDPIRTVPVILLAPGLLADRLGYLPISMLILFVFLGMLGWTLYRRTNYMGYSLACMCLFCAIPGLFSPTLGIGTYWLDLPAALLGGAAAFCLLNSSVARNERWLAGFAVLAACAALSRYVAAGYLIVMCAPILGSYLFIRWREERSFSHAVVRPTLLIGFITGLLAGYFVIAHYKANMDYYATFGYATKQGIWPSATATYRALYSFIEQPIVLCLVALLGLNLTFLLMHPARWSELLTTGWLAVAHILYLAVFVQVVGHVQATLYTLPTLFLFMIAPMSWSSLKKTGKIVNVAAIGIFVVSLGLAAHYARQNYKYADQPSPPIQERKNFDQVVAQALANQGNHLVFGSFFHDYFPIPVLEAFYGLGKSFMPGNEAYFSIHEAYLKGDYPNQTAEAISHLVYENTCRWIDIALVYDDPSVVDTRYDNDTSRAVARYVAQTIAHDPQWTRVFTVDSAVWGKLAGYRNRSPEQGGYERFLHRQLMDTGP